MFRTKSIARYSFLFASLAIGCGANDSKQSGDLQITVSAEGLGANGYAFPPPAGQEVAFVDGWAVNFERIIVAIDNIRLSSMPDKNPGDQSQFGADVAVRKGPFIVDLKKPGNAQDKGEAGRVAIRLPIDDLKDLFDLEQRYAFSYDLVAPTKEAIYVNVKKDDPDVLAMIKSGQRLLVTGQATFEGKDCQSSVPTYDFESLPHSVNFRFPLEGSVHYLNCQNPDNAGGAIDGEESQRGIQMLPHTTTYAQITVHTDHFFWPTTAHENLPLFDPFAANAALAEGDYLVDLEALNTVPVPGITDSEQQPLPWRSCVDKSMYNLPTKPATVTFEPGSQPISNLRDFVEFNATTLGHLNADGLCYVKGAEHTH